MPALPTVEDETSQQASDGPNVGAIAGGVVGGVIALIALIAVVLLCLRRRHRKQATHNQPEMDNTTTPELGGPNMAQKHITNYSVSDSSTAYSPQASSPPGTNSWSGSQHYYQGSPPHQGGEWTQAYYPPPPEPSIPSKRLSPLEVSAELPDVRSPANAELSEVRSPVNGELPELRSPIPIHGVK